MTVQTIIYSFRAIVVCAWGEKGAAATDSEGQVSCYIYIHYIARRDVGAYLTYYIILLRRGCARFFCTI